MPDGSRRRVYGDFFMGYQAREVTGGAKVWRLYYPNYEAIANSGDLYLTSDRKDTIATVYPYFAPYDTTDEDLLEYQILLGKVAGLDGFLCEWCYHTPDGEYHGDNALKVMAAMGPRFDFEVGVNWINACEFTSADGRTLFDTREEAMAKVKDDLVYLVKDIYEPHNGVYVDGRPLILTFCARDVEAPNITDSWFGPSDYDAMRKHGRANGFDPCFVSRKFLKGLLGHVDGFFPIVETHNPAYYRAPGPEEQEPWTYMSSRAQQRQFATDFYRGVEEYKDQLSVRMGAAWRAFEDQKDHAWGYGTKCYIPYEGGQTLADTWELLEQSDSDIALLWTWNDCAENTSIIPSLEAGYRDIELTAARVARWKGIQAPSPTLLRLPERLLKVRNGIRLLEKTGLGGMLDPMRGHAGRASQALAALDEHDAVAALVRAEAEFARLMEQSVSAERIRAEWTCGESAWGIELSAGRESGQQSSAGKVGQALNKDDATGNHRLGFRFGTKTREKVARRHFVGRLELEYLDRGKNWIGVQVDAKDDLWQETGRLYRPGFQQTRFTHYTGDDTPMEIANFRTDGCSEWRAVEMDVVNARFTAGLDGDDIRVLQQDDTGSVLHRLRVEGIAYGKLENARSVTGASARPRLLWAGRAGGKWPDYAYDVVMLDDGSVVVVGEFTEQATFGEGEHQVILKSAGVADIFVARYAPDGTLAWAVSAGGAYTDRATNVWIDADGAVCVAGWVFGKARFGGDAAELFCEEESPFLAKYDADTGALISARLTTPHVFGTGRLSANLPDGGSLRAGKFWIHQAFGADDGNDILLNSAGDDDVFIAAWRGDGSLAWAESAGGPGCDYANAVAVRPSGGEFAVVGVFEQEAAFGDTKLQSAGQRDIFVAKYALP